MRTPIVAGNWKMNGDVAGVDELLDAVQQELEEASLSRCEILVFPAYVHLAGVLGRVAGTGIGVGSQDVDFRQSGAVTGGVSAPMVKDIGCSYAIVGHSERRTLFQEDNETVAAKFESCLDAGLMPILCVGETLDERRSGNTVDVVTTQLDAVALKVGAAGLGRGHVAYEPVWAIGTGESATSAQAEEVHAALRSRLGELDGDMAAGMRILYGGSVNADNAASLFANENVDGALVGGASLKGKSFVDICRAADASKR